MSSKPHSLYDSEEEARLPKMTELTIDIGSTSTEEIHKIVGIDM